jgi:hypothetical protein
MFFNSLVEQVPFDWRNQTPPIIDHYPEGPGYTPPFQPPLQKLPELTFPFPAPTSTSSIPQTNPFDLTGGLAGKYMNSAMGGSPVWAGALGGLLGAGLNFFGKRRR